MQRCLLLLAALCSNACSSATPTPPEAPRQSLANTAKASSSDTPPARETITAWTTLTFGCSCPTFHFGENETFDWQYVLPVVASGPDPADTLLPDYMGSYELTGRFAEPITPLEWIERRGRAPSNFDRRQAGEYWSQPAPVFVVDSWCFRLAPDNEETPDGRRLYRSQLSAMETQHAICSDAGP